MKQDLEKTDSVYFSNFLSKKKLNKVPRNVNTVPGGTTEIPADPTGKTEYQKKDEENKLVETINVRFDEYRKGIDFKPKTNGYPRLDLNFPDYDNEEDDFDTVRDSLASRLVSKTSTETSSTSFEKPDLSSDNRSLIPCSEVKWIRNIGGRLRLDVSLHNRTDVEDLLRRSPYLRGRGSWTPRGCVPQHRVALIIPYRDRLEHLATLLYTLHPLLQRQLLEYRVYVVEQYGNDTFNKGVLMNAGVREALRDSDFHCFVFHDVDMIPEDDRNLYSCPEMPRHLSVAVDKFNYTLPYTLLVGGVFSIRLEHFLAVNGYSNLYWGWGGEDDDMAYRIKYRKLEIIRPPETIARYSMIKHDHRPESPNAIRTALLRMAKKRSSRDGLNTVKYRVVWRHEHLAYTHLMVDIGQHHRWQFLNGQRLIINF
ncbi:beta-1,4-N-acetylgalactosaminyltransferase bre-4 [Trichonephila clavata]|uniref:Beta-1,4-N-acetylgalactosaminyltransferase n=1 Tax=Trichonephila clavata TaxID=2740835 RepID=A0A8X6HVQ5_TRICU|nr:beta-1,4-N-acetylgalactosaminyltransferase bre-4 [Trichonephila clavata]